MIEGKHIYKKFGEKIALSDIGFTVKKGTIVGIIGPNGSGKTTLINCILGNLEYQGDIIWNENKSIFVIPDDNNLPELITGREYINFILDIYKKNIDSNKENYLLELFDMEDDVDKYIKSYSYGMKKKIQIIASFLLNPSLIILDEIFRGLDIESIITIKELLKLYVNSGGTIIMSSHDILVVEQICTHIIMIYHGSIRIQGTPEYINGIYKDMSLEEIFLKLIGDKKNVKSIF